MTSRSPAGIALATTAALSGCALPQSTVPVPTTIFHDTSDPAQYRSAQPHDAQPPPQRIVQAHGESCVTALYFPPNPPTPFLGSASVAAAIPWPSLDITWGNDGYRRAVASAVAGAGGGTLVDVRADVHTTSVLGIWRRDCIEVHGFVAR